MKKKKQWDYLPGDWEDGKQITGAGITTPEGKSIFQIDLGDFYGISNKTAERIVNLLNRNEKP
jgi:hypothetical protein